MKCDAPAIQLRNGSTVVPSDCEAISCVHDLVSIASVSGNERACVEKFVSLAASWGFEVEIDGAGNGIATRRRALTGREIRVGDNERLREVVLLGHIDTVPGDIPVRIENGVLHGRGSVDAKGPLAAMLAGAARADIPDGCVVRVIAAVGEETPHSVGAHHAAATLRPDACIIGEPSGWSGVTLGYKGRLVMHATVTQAPGHSAGPGASAGDAIVAFWMRCVDHATSLNASHAGAFDVVQATLRSVSTSSDGLQDVASLHGGFRLPLRVSPIDIETSLQAIAREFPSVTLAFEGHEFAHVSDRNDVVVRALSNAIRASGSRPHPKTKTGTADMNVVAPIWKCPIAAYGPGDSSLDHTPNEHVPLDEFIRSVEVLAKAIPEILDAVGDARG